MLPFNVAVFLLGCATFASCNTNMSLAMCCSSLQSQAPFGLTGLGMPVLQDIVSTVAALARGTWNFCLGAKV